MEDGGKKRTHHANGLRIATRCETAEQFVEKFHRFCEDGAVFVPHASRLVGTDTAFSFDLANGTSALCGLGTVTDHFTDAENRFGRPGVVIGIRRLQPESQHVLEQMQLARGAQDSVRGPGKRSPTLMITPSTPQETVRHLDRATPLPVKNARAMTSAIEIVDSVAFKTATIPGPTQRTRTSPIAVVTMPTQTAPSAKLANSSSSLTPAAEEPPDANAPVAAESVPTAAPFADSSGAVASAPRLAAATEPPANRPRDDKPPGDVAVVAQPLVLEPSSGHAEQVMPEAEYAAPHAEYPALRAEQVAPVAAPPSRHAEQVGHDVAEPLAARVNAVAVSAVTPSVRRRLRDALLGGVVGGAIVLAGAILMWPRDRHPPEPSLPSPAPATTPAAAPPVTPSVSPAGPAADQPPTTPPDTSNAVTTPAIAKKALVPAKKKPIPKKVLTKRKVSPPATKPLAKKKAACTSLSCM